jgi:hypothetical protein
MKISYRINLLVMVLFTLLALASAFSDASNVQPAEDPIISQAEMEEQGLEKADMSEPKSSGKGENPALIADSLPNNDVLLIPDSGADNVGMYDPITGDFLGVFIAGHSGFSTPICAVTGPDGNVYVSDQVADAVFVFDRGGNYVFTYADASDGLNNIRGIDFRGGHLFVTSGDDYVAEFSGPHTRLTNFIEDGSDPFDIHFLPDGRALLADIQGTTDNVRLYNADGSFASQLFSVNFPEQIQSDSLAPGAYLNASFTADTVRDFDIDGSTAQITPWNDGRGVYRLGNGNLLLTSGLGVFEVEPGTGVIIAQKSAVTGRFIELCRAPQGPELGFISGTVYSVPGVPLPGERVIASGVDTDTTFSGVDGLYITGPLQPGLYDVAFYDAVYGDTTVTAVTVVANDTTILDMIRGSVPDCEYLIGDFSGDNQRLGGDVTYGVRFFKGVGLPPPDSCFMDSTGAYLYVAGDCNGNCEVRGSDITRLVAYFKGVASLSNCHFFPTTLPR